MSHFDIEAKEKELQELEKQTTTEGFWNDTKNSSVVLKKIKTIKDQCSKYHSIKDNISNLLEMTELVMLENDEKLANDIINNTKSIKEEIDALEIETLLSGKYDINNAIVTIHPGAGGTESQDWAEMLYRMYTRWANNKRL